MNERSSDGTTPLINITKYSWRLKSFDRITEARCADGKLDWNARDCKGYTALDYALGGRKSDLKVIRLLKRYMDILEHDRGGVIEVKNWMWTYGQSGYRCPSNVWCQCSPMCEGARNRREDVDEDEEHLAIPGAFI